VTERKEDDWGGATPMIPRCHEAADAAAGCGGGNGAIPKI
jgi:hypothetical protein